MFHLIISSWETGEETFLINRLYFRDDPLFQDQSGKLSNEKIKEIPALLMSEEGEQAYVIEITNFVQKNSKEVAVSYKIINNTTPILVNSIIDRIRFAKDWGRQHTCWSVHEGDLYKLVFQSEKQIIKPKVFQFDPAMKTNHDLISVMMPFNESFYNVYQALTKSVTAIGKKIKRADSIFGNQAVIQDIFQMIVEARIIICDVTGKNANVFYEAGIAHTLGKDVIFITQNDEDVPFDIKHLRYTKYLNNQQGLEELSTKIINTIQAVLK